MQNTILMPIHTELRTVLTAVTTVTLQDVMCVCVSVSCLILLMLHDFRSNTQWWWASESTQQACCYRSNAMSKLAAWCCEWSLLIQKALEMLTAGRGSAAGRISADNQIFVATKTTSCDQRNNFNWVNFTRVENSVLSFENSAVSAVQWVQKLIASLV